MNSCKPEWTIEKRVNLDGVKYDICIIPKGQEFKAAWVCTKCHEQSAFDPVSSTRSQAVEWAGVGLRVHHNFVHRR